MTRLRLWSDEIEALRPGARAAVDASDGPFAASRREQDFTGMSRARRIAKLRADMQAAVGTKISFPLGHCRVTLRDNSVNLELGGVMGVGSSRSVFGSQGRLRVLMAAVLVAGVVSVATFAASGVASASTVVTNCNDSGTGSLRAAVVSGGTTTFALSPPCSTITLTSGPITLATNVTISGPGAALLAVSGGGVSQVFVISAGVNATISGLTIENGNNTSGVGGGIDNRGGTVTVSDSTISGNTDVHAAGGICNGDGGDGGGTLCDGSGTLTLTNSTVSGNTAGGTGGGIANGSGIDFARQMALGEASNGWIA